jgi:nicotinamide-nucleotide amidase
VTIVTAESCTGGSLAAALSRADGAGKVLHGGFITYTKENKSAALGVSARVLNEQGAVNEDVAQQMADGALERSPAMLAVAVTGVLGPEPDDDGNPVGRVHLCCKLRGNRIRRAHEEFGKKPPDEILRAIVLRAFELIERTMQPDDR